MKRTIGLYGVLLSLVFMALVANGAKPEKMPLLVGLKVRKGSICDRWKMGASRPQQTDALRLQLPILNR